MRSRIIYLLPVLFIGCIVALSIIFGSWYTIDQGQRGVVLRYGKIISIEDPGLGFKLPLVDSVVKISTQNQARKYEKLQAYSRDQQAAEIDVSVSYSVPVGDVAKLYSQYGDIEGMLTRLLDRNVPNQVENTFGKYNAVSAVQDRARFVKELTDAIKASVTGPIIITGVQVENMDFSDAYERSIEERMNAEVAVATRKQNLETERVNAEIAVTQAQAKADAQLAQAKAGAEATLLQGKAEAESIKLRGDALRMNPQIVGLTTAERWDGKLPQTMLPGGAVPFINAQ